MEADGPPIFLVRNAPGQLRPGQPRHHPSVPVKLQVYYTTNWPWILAPFFPTAFTGWQVSKTVSVKHYWSMIKALHLSIQVTKSVLANLHISYLHTYIYMYINPCDLKSLWEERWVGDRVCLHIIHCTCTLSPIWMYVFYLWCHLVFLGQKINYQEKWCFKLNLFWWFLFLFCLCTICAHSHGFSFNITEYVGISDNIFSEQRLPHLICKLPLTIGVKLNDMGSLKNVVKTQADWIKRISIFKEENIYFCLTNEKLTSSSVVLMLWSLL